MFTNILFGMPGGTELLVLLIIFFLPAALVVWALIDIIRSQFENNTMKLLWVVVVILLPLLGSLLYIIIGRRERIQ